MVKYYDATVEDALRIAIVDGDDDYESDGEEIAASDLPADFAEWKTYTQFFKGTPVRVVSKNGD